MSDPRYPALYQVNTRVWLTGPAAQAISRANPEWRREFVAMLPDLKDEDIAGSGFAIQSYTVHRDLGGAAGALAAAAATTRTEADARLRAESHGAGSPMDRSASRILRPQKRK